MHQGWPKLAFSVIQGMDKGLLVAHMLPVSAETMENGKSPSIRAGHVTLKKT